MSNEISKFSAAVIGWASGRPLRCGSSSTSVCTGLEMGVAIVGTTSAESGTSSPVGVLILIDTASIYLCNGLVAPNDDKLMFSNLSGVKARSVANFSVRKDRCDPSSNSTLASVCRLMPTTVAIAVFNRQVVCWASWRGANVVNAPVSAVVALVVGALLVELVVAGEGEAILLGVDRLVSPTASLGGSVQILV